MSAETPIAILSALAEEQEGLLEHLQDARRVDRWACFWTGRLQGLPVVLALSRIGKVAAATTATRFNHPLRRFPGSVYRRRRRGRAWSPGGRCGGGQPLMCSMTWTPRRCSPALRSRCAGRHFSQQIPAFGDCL